MHKYQNYYCEMTILLQFVDIIWSKSKFLASLHKKGKIIMKITMIFEVLHIGNIYIRKFFIHIMSMHTFCGPVMFLETYSWFMQCHHYGQNKLYISRNSSVINSILQSTVDFAQKSDAERFLNLTVVP